MLHAIERLPQDRAHGDVGCVHPCAVVTELAGSSDFFYAVVPAKVEQNAVQLRRCVHAPVVPNYLGSIYPLKFHVTHENDHSLK